MAAVELLIGKLAERKIREAVEGLKTPRNRDAYELGRLAGVQQGLAIAQELLDEAIGEDENAEEQQPTRRKK